MTTKQILIATITGAVALLLFDGLFQAIPNVGIRAVERFESAELTTAKFSELANQMAYIATEETVSLVAVKEADYYNLPKFFAIESVSALAIALLLTLLFSKIKLHSLKDKLFLTSGFAMIASFGIHIPYFNWWGFSLPYTVGVVLKTVLGWLLVVFIQNHFIAKTK